MVTRDGPVKSTETVLPIAAVGGVFKQVRDPDIITVVVKHDVPCGVDGEPMVCVQVILIQIPSLPFLLYQFDPYSLRELFSYSIQWSRYSIMWLARALLVSNIFTALLCYCILIFTNVHSTTVTRNTIDNASGGGFPLTWHSRFLSVR